MAGDRRLSTKNKEKLKALNRVDGGETIKVVAASQGVTRVTLWRWKKQRAAIEASAPARVYIGEKVQVSALSAQVQEKLLAWIRHMRGAQLFCITTECIRIALAYFHPDFVSSQSRDAVKMFIFRFLKRNRLTYRRITHRGRVPRRGMQIVADRFSEAVLHHVESPAFFPVGMLDRYEYLFNVDQTSVCVDMNPHSTIEFVGAKTVDVIQSVTPDSFRASVFLCASATGRKLRPMFAGTPGAAVHDELQMSQHFDWDKDYYTVQAKAYCDRQVMLEWIDNVWAPDIVGPSVLLLDSLKTHKMDSVRARLEEHAHTSVMYVPPGVTGLSQPMDVAVMKPFKDRCREIYTTYVIESGIFTSAAQKRRAIAQSVLRAWDGVSEGTIRNGFLKADLIATDPRS